MTRIKIPAEAWMDWPTEPGYWLMQFTPHDDCFQLLGINRYELDDEAVEIGGKCYLHKGRTGGYRFARVRFVIVPQARNADPCEKGTER